MFSYPSPTVVNSPVKITAPDSCFKVWREKIGEESGDILRHFDRERHTDSWPNRQRHLSCVMWSMFYYYHLGHAQCVTSRRLPTSVTESSCHYTSPEEKECWPWWAEEPMTSLKSDLYLKDNTVHGHWAGYPASQRCQFDAMFAARRQVSPLDWNCAYEGVVWHSWCSWLE